MNLGSVVVVADLDSDPEAIFGSRGYLYRSVAPIGCVPDEQGKTVTVRSALAVEMSRVPTSKPAPIDRSMLWGDLFRKGSVQAQVYTYVRALPGGTLVNCENVKVHVVAGENTVAVALSYLAQRRLLVGVGPRSHRTYRVPTKSEIEDGCIFPPTWPPEEPS